MTAPADPAAHPMADPAALAALHGRCFALPPPWTQADFAALLPGNGVFLALAPAGAEQGFLLGRALAGEAEILTLAIAPEARRQGLAQGLIAAFFRQARALGAETAFLEVAADNHAALALYQQAGFAAVGRRRGYYRAAPGAAGDGRAIDTPAIDAIVMRAELTAQA